MNAITDLFTNRKRGSLKRKLAKAQRMEDTTEAVKVLGPYACRDKQRLVVTSPSGRRSVSFDTLAQAQTAKRNLMASADESANMSVAELLDIFLAEKRRQGSCEKSLVGTYLLVTRLLNPKLIIAKIDTDLAERLYEKIIGEYAVATHQVSLRAVKSMFRLGIRRKLITSNPFAEVLPFGKQTKGKLQLRTDEAKKLTTYLLNSAKEGNWCNLTLLVQLFLGLRSSEVLKIRKRDLDCGGSILCIDGTKTKNAKRKLELRIGAVVDCLADRVKSLEPSDYVFSVHPQRQSSTTTLWKHLRKVCALLELPTVCPHSLRGLHSSLAVQAGATSSAVANALGHGSDVVTRRHYIAASALESSRLESVSHALMLSPEDLRDALASMSETARDELLLTFGYRR